MDATTALPTGTVTLGAGSGSPPRRTPVAMIATVAPCPCSSAHSSLPMSGGTYRSGDLER
jgi:hypothetical protein